MFSSTVFKVVSMIFFTTSITGWYTLLSESAMIFGLWGIFRKCGVKPWEALIPFYREIRLGEAAGREREGRVTMVSRIVFVATNIPLVFLENRPDMPSQIPLILSLVSIVTSIVLLIYLIRVYSGLS